MKRVLVITVICLLLGVVTTVAVAWALSTAIPYPPYFSGRADAGLTVGEGAGWYVRREERPGVRCEIGWPVSDVDDFLGEKTRDELGALAFVVDVRDWARAFATAPDSDATAPMLRIEDSRGWPFLALARSAFGDLTDEIARLHDRVVQQGGRTGPMSEFNAALFASGPLPADLLAEASLPVGPLWPGFLANTLVYGGGWFLAFGGLVAFQRLTGHRSIRWRVGLAGALLVFGCFSTIAVAWACAAWVPVGTQPQDGHEGSGVGLWFVQRNDSFGVTRVESDHIVNGVGSFLASVTPAAAILPEWAEAHIHLGGSTEQLRFFGTGLPLRALQCRVKLDTFGAGTDHWRGGFALKSRPADPPSPTMLVPALPYQPIWIGFVVDTILFALAGGVLFAVVRTAFQARRSWRSRRHRCPACGYDLRGTPGDTCPECGRRRDAAAS